MLTLAIAEKAWGEFYRGSEPVSRRAVEWFHSAEPAGFAWWLNWTFPAAVAEILLEHGRRQLGEVTRLKEQEVFPEEDAEFCENSGYCSYCGGRGFYVSCPDDLCHGSEECMHGDGYSNCPQCNADGKREWDI